MAAVCRKQVLQKKKGYSHLIYCTIQYLQTVTNYVKCIWVLNKIQSMGTIYLSEIHSVKLLELISVIHNVNFTLYMFITKCNTLCTYSRIPLIRFTQDQMVIKSSDIPDYPTGPLLTYVPYCNFFVTAPTLGLQDEWQYSHLAVFICWPRYIKESSCVSSGVFTAEDDGVGDTTVDVQTLLETSLNLSL